MEILVTVDPRECIAGEPCLALASGQFQIGAAGYSSPTRAAWTADEPLELRDAETSAIMVEAEEG